MADGDKVQEMYTRALGDYMLAMVKLVKATAALPRATKPCIECNGSGRVCGE